MATKTFTPGHKDGKLTGATAVDIVDSPAVATQRMVRSIQINNRDTAAVKLTVTYFNGTDKRRIFRGTLFPDRTWHLPEHEVLVLEDDSSTIKAELDAAVATIEPDFVSSHADFS